MYIATGTPKVISSRTGIELGGGFELLQEAVNPEKDKSSSTILMMKKAPSKKVFASITPHTLSLWSIKVFQLDPAGDLTLYCRQRRSYH
jgi:hypothetical protein